MVRILNSFDIKLIVRLIMQHVYDTVKQWTIPLIIEIANWACQVYIFCLSFTQWVRFRPLHVLLLNAGVYSPPQKSTEDGLETTYGVNHVAQFYLTQLLLPKLKESAPSRVVIVSSDLHASNKV